MRSGIENPPTRGRGSTPGAPQARPERRRRSKSKSEIGKKRPGATRRLPRLSARRDCVKSFTSRSRKRNENGEDLPTAIAIAAEGRSEEHPRAPERRTRSRERAAQQARFRHGLQCVRGQSSCCDNLMMLMVSLTPATKPRTQDDPQPGFRPEMLVEKFPEEDPTIGASARMNGIDVSRPICRQPVSFFGSMPVTQASAHV